MKSAFSQMMGLMALGLIGGYPPINHNDKSPVSLETIDVTPKELPIPKGHKKFVIDGKEIYALNYKNAKKKADKLK